MRQLLGGHFGHPFGRNLLQPEISVTEVNLARVPKALEGEVRGGSSLEGAVVA
jgi:hypothetical protein